MQLPRQFPIFPIRADETRYRNRTAVCEQKRHFGDASDILISVGLAEAEITVQAKAYVVAIQPVGGEGGVEEVLFEGCCDGGFARGREAGQPDCETRLGTEGGAFRMS